MGKCHPGPIAHLRCLIAGGGIFHHRQVSSSWSLHDRRVLEIQDGHLTRTWGFGITITAPSPASSSVSTGLLPRFKRNLHFHLFPLRIIRRRSLRTSIVDDT